MEGTIDSMTGIVVPLAFAGHGLLLPVLAAIIFLGVPWLLLHYLTQWRRARGLSVEDERLLDDLHDLARRLEDRVQTLERIVAAEDPDWRVEQAGAPGPTTRRDRF